MIEVPKIKGIKSVTIVAHGPVVGLTPITYKAKSKRKKQSKRLRVFERLAAQVASAAKVYGDSYLTRHKRSNIKKRDGWYRDLSDNRQRAKSAAMKKIKLRKLFD